MNIPFLDHVIKDALAAVEPAYLVREHLRIEDNRLFIKHRPFDLSQFDKIHVIGVGKGAPFLFHGLDEVLGERIKGGMVISLEQHQFSHPRVTFFPGSHPIPDQKSLAAGHAVSRYIKTNVKSHDLLFFLVTGGASALMVQPAPGLKMADKMAINRLLLESGADISEINCVRKCLSAIKGGRLARLAHPARVISLILSDVIDSPLSDIGSGPSIPAAASFRAASAILKSYHLTQKISNEVKQFFNDSIKREVLEESAALAYPGLQENAHFLLADNRIALEAAKESAEKMGIPAQILTSRDKGEASEAAKLYAAILKEIIYTRTPFAPPVLLISGGELTVTLKPPPGSRTIEGKGGRNQAFILNLLKELKTVGHPYFAASIGTDGIDGPTDAAGAWIDHHTIARVKELSLSIDGHLKHFDSYTFFNRLGQLVKTGPTRTNVMDLRLLYIPIRNGARTVNTPKTNHNTP